MTQNLHIAVILPAAGLSKRFGEKNGSKLDADIAGKPVLQRAIELFTDFKQVEQIIVAVDPDNLDAFKFKWVDKLSFMPKPVKIVAGGKAERWETVLNALEAVQEGVTHVAVHDAARPVADRAMIQRVFDAAAQHHAIFPGVPVSSTLRRVNPEPEQTAQTAADADPLDAILGAEQSESLHIHAAQETVPREDLWQVQTPQVIALGLMHRAYQRIKDAPTHATNITDDIALVEALGEPTAAVRGDSMNIKITLPGDLPLAEAIFKLRSKAGAADLLGPKRKHKTWAQMGDDE
ncbi:MAG: IspD/TarI family cytidylyltransferase [Planctomycetota bacterium]|jgi:2-C-methyl-D-erythritol 4-phosphate cytidylyltransferase